MARDHDRNRIRTDGLPHRPSLIGLAHLPGDLTVRCHMPVRHSDKSIIHHALELRGHAGEIQAHVEGGPVFGEVLLQLLDSMSQLLRPLLLGVRMAISGQRTEFDPANSKPGRPDSEGADPGPRQVRGVDFDRRGQFSSPPESPSSFLRASCSASKPRSAHLMRTGNLETP